jgi:hypothetical protein
LTLKPQTENTRGREGLELEKFLWQEPELDYHIRNHIYPARQQIVCFLIKKENYFVNY